MTRRRYGFTFGALLLVPLPALAQQGTIVGSVIDQETRAGVASAEIEVSGGGQTARAVADASGQFRISIAPGSYSVVVRNLAYETRRIDGVTVTTGQATPLEIALTSFAYTLDPLVIIGRGPPEKASDSPSIILEIDKKEVSDRAALSPVDHVKALPGVDISQTGLQTSNVVTRGFNNIFSGALLVIADYRYASVPSLRFNAYNMIPTTQFDVDRIEMLIGPAAALYGPNSADGVMHIITSSPLDEPGNAISVAGGERSVFQTQFRTAHLLSENVGLKVSGQYFRGSDWEFVDPAEEAAKARNPNNPLIGNRDFAAERFGGEARLDWRPWDDDGDVVLSAGLNSVGSSVELTGTGAAQAQDWRYTYLQARVSKDRFFAQAFLNKSDAGDSYLLRTGQIVVDQSDMMVGQLQHGLALGERQDFTYGLDLQQTTPKTQGTITGANEDDDDITEIGGYVVSNTSLSDRFTLQAAFRIDDHSRLQDLVFSPRAALLFQPAQGQNFRLTFNRAFSTPTTNNLFLDLVASANPFGVGSDIRLLGVPETGFTFEERCPGGVMELCMISPFPIPGVPPGTRIPAVAADAFWNPIILGAQQRAQALGLPQLVAVLEALLDPSPGVLQTALLRFNQGLAEAGEFPFVVDDGPDAIDPIRPTISTTYELGYMGLLDDRLLINAGVYMTRLRDFIGPLRAESPTVHYSVESIGALVASRLGAAALQDPQIQLLIGQLGSVPVGTVAPDQRNSPDVVFTYRNFGDVDLWGADLGFEFLANDRWAINGSYSRVSDDCFRFSEGGDDGCTNPFDIALNAPTNKGSLGVRYEDAGAGLTASARVRMSDGFPMNSGVYVGQVEGWRVLDANVAYRLRSLPGATLSLTANNLLDNVHREFVGAPEIGRLLMLRLQYEF